MARKRKNGFDTSALVKYAERLEAAGGTATVKRAVEGGMKSTKQEVNKLVTTAMQAGNLPAGGAYSTGATMESLNEIFTVEWAGNVANLPLGFDLSGDGIASIFLMYGTPKMAPAAGLREALKENPRKISRKEMQAAALKILERLGG